MPKERSLAHLDRDLVGSRRDELDVADAGQGRDLVAHLLAEPLERRLTHEPGHRHIDDLHADRDLLDLGPLRLDGQPLDAIDAGLHVAHALRDVFVRAHLDADRAASFVGRRVDALDAAEALQRLLDAHADRLFDLGR